ncbi:MAG: hypothetical protein IT548_14970 [Alphaproteobacteria bacterium]|nr:hypothetical protein [Alphaproteobacteria bacterium]
MSTALVSRSGSGPKPAVALTPAGLRLVEELAAKGNDIATVAKRLGIGRTTLVGLKKSTPAVSQAFETGHAALADELTHILLTQARNGVVVAAIFLAKTRLGWRETGPQDGGTKVAVQINLPAAMDPAAYATAIEAKVVSDDA